MCRECTMHAEYHACSCSSEAGYAEEVIATFVDTFVAPLLLKEDDIVNAWSSGPLLYAEPFSSPWPEHNDALARQQEEIDHKNRRIILQNLRITAQQVAMSVLQ